MYFCSDWVSRLLPVAKPLPRQSVAAAVVCGFLYYRDFHDRFLVPERENRSRKAAQDDKQPKEDSQALAPTAAGTVMVVNAQRTEVVYGRVCWHGHAFGDP